MSDKLEIDLNNPKKWPPYALINLAEAVLKRELSLHEKAAFYIGKDNYSERKEPEGRHFRNGHLMAMAYNEWDCRFCFNRYDSVYDADKEVCEKG